MANNDINEIGAILRGFLSELKRISPKDNKKQTKYSDNVEKSAKDKSIDPVTKAFSDLRKEVHYNIEEQKTNRASIRSWKDTIMDIAKGTHRFKEDIDNVGAQMRKNTKYSSDEFRKISNDTFRTFKDIIGSGKDFSGELEKMTNAQSGLMKILSNVTDKSKTIEDKIKNLYNEKEKKLSDIDDLKKSKKGASPENKQKLDDELKAQRESLAKLNSEIKNEEKARTLYIESLTDNQTQLVDALENVKKLKSMGIDLLQGIDQEKLKDNNFFKQSSSQQAQITQQLEKNIRASALGADVAYQAQRIAANKQKERTGEVLAKFIEDTYKLGKVQFYSDYKSRRNYGIEGSVGTGLITQGTGISETQANELMGQNRILFNTLGHGNASSVFGVGGGFGALQRKQAVFGKYGEDAAENVVKIGNALMESGFAPKNIGEMTDQLGKLNTATGMTSDQLVDYYTDLTNSSLLTITRDQLAGKSDKEQLDITADLIKKQIDYGRQLGITTDDMKKMSSEALSEKHGSYLDYMKRRIGAQMGVGFLNSQLKPGEEPVDLEAASTDTYQMEQLRNSTLPGDQEKFARLYAGKENIAKITNRISTEGYGNGGIMPMMSVLGDLNPQLFGGNAVEDLLTQKRRADARNQDTLGLNGGKDLQDVIVGPTDLTTKAMDKLADSTLLLKQYFDSITHNPLGGGLGGVVDFLGESIGATLIQRLINGRGSGGLLNGIAGKIFKGSAGKAAAGAAEGIAGDALFAGGEAAAGGGIAALTGAFGDLLAVLTGPVGLTAAIVAAGVGLFKLTETPEQKSHLDKLQKLMDMQNDVHEDQNFFVKTINRMGGKSLTSSSVLNDANTMTDEQVNSKYEQYKQNYKQKTELEQHFQDLKNRGKVEVQFIDPMDQVTKAKELQKQNGLSLISDRFSGTGAQFQHFGDADIVGGQQVDRQIEKLMLNGLDENTLRKAGASEEYIKEITTQLNNDKSDPKTLALLKLVDNTNKANDLTKQQMTKDDMDKQQQESVKNTIKQAFAHGKALSQLTTQDLASYQN